MNGDADQPGQHRRGLPGRPLHVVRIFARHLQALDPATEVPPDDVLWRRRYLRIQPYLYSPAEIAALMNAADDLRPALRAATWRTLIGLLAVTGMRQGEACRLLGDDADLETGTLVIRDSRIPASPGWCSCTRQRSWRCAPMSGRATARSPSRRRPRSW